MEAEIDNRLRKLIEQMRQKPVMYIGRYSITRFSSFLDGYFFALYELDGAEPEQVLLDQIQASVEAKYQFNIAKGWDNILLFVTDNEATAFDLFWTIWDDEILPSLAVGTV